MDHKPFWKFLPSTVLASLSLMDFLLFVLCVSADAHLQLSLVVSLGLRGLCDTKWKDVHIF